MRGVLDHRLEFSSDLPFHSRFTQFPSTPPSTPLNPEKPKHIHSQRARDSAHAPAAAALYRSTSPPLYHRAQSPRSTTDSHDARLASTRSPTTTTTRLPTPLASSTSRPVPLYLSTTARSPPKTPRYAARGLLQPDRRRRRRCDYRCNSPVPPPTSHLHERDLPHAQHHTRTSGARP